jgi:hypothetical protein
VKARFDPCAAENYDPGIGSASATLINKGYGMIRSLLGLLLILIGISLMAAGLNDDSSVLGSQSARLYGSYFGATLLVLGIIIGKFWSLKWQPKRKTSAGAFAGTSAREEPVEEQIDLFEPRNKV